MKPKDSLEKLNLEIVNCRKCPRLVEWREKMAVQKKRAFIDWEYWGKPVPGFGDIHGRILVLGLAPGAHGSNRTGRMFTGDASGDFLFPSLFRAGFANQPQSVSIDDGLRLKDIFITATCRCAPPDNKPTRQEIENCHAYLVRELIMMHNLQGIVALGSIGFDSALYIMSENFHIDTNPKPKFAHGQTYFTEEKTSPWLIASYHPSRQNTQTGRLTVDMFDSIWNKALQLVD